jgi:hypothetical protein
MVKVLCQCWEESERGWGTRPEGFSLHKDEEALKRYIDKHWETYPKDYVPDEYERPCGKAYSVNVPEQLYQIIAMYNGIPFGTPRGGPKPDDRFPEKGVNIPSFINQVRNGINRVEIYNLD